MFKCRALRPWGSVRKYKKDPLSKEVFNKILEAGRRAPSAANRQPWHFIVVTDEEVKRKLASGRFNSFVKDTAFIIVGVSMPYDPVSERWGIIDTTIVMQNIVLAAEVQGVGSFWTGDFREDEVKNLLGIPEKGKIVALISMGIPDEKPSEKQKKNLEIIHYNPW